MVVTQHWLLPGQCDTREGFKARQMFGESGPAMRDLEKASVMLNAAPTLGRTKAGAGSDANASN